MKLFALMSLFTSLTASAITIGAYNIRNFDYDERYRITTDKSALADILKSLNADVLGVEEINNKEEFENFVHTRMPGYEVKISNCGGEHGQHLGFIYNSAVVDMLSFQEDLTISDPGKQGVCNGGSRPLAIGLFQIKKTHQKFYGFTVHLKSGSDSSSVLKRNKQYEILKNVMVELRNKSGVKDFYMAGDFNTTEYLSRGTDYQALTKIVAEMGMIDLAKDTACSAYWWGGSDDGIETPSLLDHVLATPGLVKLQGAKAQAHGHCQVVSCKEASLQELGISYEAVSDHCPLTATIQ